MVFWRLVAISAAVVCSILSPNLGSAESLRHQAPLQHVHVYLLRSFIVFSSGIYDLAATFRTEGINAPVHNYFEWPFLAEQAIANYREGLEDSIIIIGHSSGADAALSMAGHLAQTGVVPSLVITLDPVGTGVLDGKHDRVLNVYIVKAGVPVARGQSFGDQLVNLELKDHKVWRASRDKSLPTVDQLILGSVSEAAVQTPARRRLFPQVSERVRRRAPAPMADDDSFKRHRSATSNTHGVGRPLSKAMPQREELSPDERRALFQQFLEWSAKQQSR